MDDGAGIALDRKAGGRSEIGVFLYFLRVSVRDVEEGKQGG